MASDGDTLAQIAAQLSSLAVLAAGQAQKIAELSERVAAIEMQLDVDSEASQLSLGGERIVVR